MTFRSGIGKLAVCCLFATTLAGGSFVSRAANATATTPAKPDPKQAALERLRHDFTRKVGRDLSQADLYLQGAGKVELAEHASGTFIGDGEPLLLHAVIADGNIGLPQDIYSVMQAPRLMISLGDFVNALGFSIKVNPEKGIAEGWFIKADHTFILDANKREATVRGKAMVIDTADIDTSGSDILISSDLLESWFGLDFRYDFAGLTLVISSKEKLPAAEAYLRSQKGKRQIFGDGPVKLPYQEQPYALITQPYIDTNVGGILTHSRGGPSQKSGSWSSIFTGDLLGFNGQGFASGGLQKPYFDSFRGSLGKIDFGANLLGPLHATSYTFGDINTVSSSLIGGGALEEGIRVSNHPLTGVTSSTYTIIRGNAQPGWDIELYRNEVYVDIRHVGTDGLYDFGNVDLYGGDNDFKLLFFGPHGELREEHQKVGVNPLSVGNRKGYWDFSLSRNGTTTFQNLYKHGTYAQNAFTGEPHFGATYEYGLGKLGTANFGTRTQLDKSGDTHSFAQAGLATYLLGTYLNADVGYAADNSATAEVLTVRRNFGKQSALVQFTTNSSGFNTSSGANNLGIASDQFNIQDPTGTNGNAGNGSDSATIRNSIRASLSGPLANKFLFLNRLNYNLTGARTNLYAGGYQENGNASLSTGIKNISLSGGLGYSHTIDATGDTSTTEVGTFSARGPLWGGVWRFQSQYGIRPEFKLVSDELEYDRPILPNLDSTTTFTYTPSPPQSPVKTLATSLNWQTSKATISPTLSIDNRHNMAAGVNVHFGAGADPYSHIYSMYNQYMTTNGGVAARVFLDKNGDGIYDNGDELMPEVVVKAMQAHRQALTNKKGIAFIPDLPQNLLTDIAVDQATFKDAANVSLFKGVAIRPHPGGITRLEFPVVVAGTMDGQANYADARKGPQPARNLTIQLVAPDGVVANTVSAAYDGYWSIDLVKPGMYYLVAKTDDDMAPGWMTPKLMEFKADGTTDFGHAINLHPGHNIEFKFRSENAPPDGPNHARVITPGDIESSTIYLELGRYHSKLAMAVAWYRLRMRLPHWQEQFDLVKPIGDIKREGKSGDFSLLAKTRNSPTLDQAAEICRNLQDMKFECAVQVVTHYRPLRMLPTLDDGTISGAALIASADGKTRPLAGLRMDLFDSDGQYVMAAVTDMEGRYRFSKVPSGAYLLMADAADVYQQHLLRPAPEFIDLAYGNMAANERDVTLIPAAGSKQRDVPVMVRRDLGDYASINPSIDSGSLKSKVVVLNLGAYHSRQLMAVTWYKLKKKYPAVTKDAKLLVQPAESNMSPKTGKNILRAALPGYDVKDAWSRCNTLSAAGEACAVEVLPKGLPELTAAEEEPSG